MFKFFKRIYKLEEQMQSLIDLNAQRKELEEVAARLNKLDKSIEDRHLLGKSPMKWQVSSSKPRIERWLGSLTLEEAKIRVYDLTRSKN